MVDNAPRGAVYKGLALGAGGTGALLYATDFRNGRVDVFDAAFQPVTLPGTPSTIRTCRTASRPSASRRSAATSTSPMRSRTPDREKKWPAAASGWYRCSSPTGEFVRRLITRGALNAPWGLALAPASFGKFGNRLLVGQFRRRRDQRLRLANGRFAGRLRGTDREPLRIDGLWGLAFGNGVNNQPLNTLFFTAGPNDEEHGLYGRIDVARDDMQADVHDAE